MRARNITTYFVLYFIFIAFSCGYLYPTIIKKDILKVDGATIDVPQFSVNHGFYKESFDVVVSSQNTNAKIKYTLDGSDPVSSITALIKDSPATIRIDPESEEGQRAKSPGVVLRACTYISDSEIGQSVTNTYLFINEVVELSPDGKKPGPNWPEPNKISDPTQYINYGLDPDILHDVRYKDKIEEALLAIPTISISTDLKNLFNLATGIYVNAAKDGSDWERPASIELLKPDSSDEGFQINAGIRIRGGYSRDENNPKHGFRFFFKKKYGKGKLDYPLFEDEGVSEFDKVDLRTSQNYSWSYKNSSGKYNTMNRDVFSRDLQREMGQPYTRSRYYHLYINGVYWGLFQTEERPEAHYAESYLGGISDDYDVIKVNSDGYNIEATDGNTDAYKEVWNACQIGFKSNENYYKLQGLNIDGSENLSYKNLVDIDNLIDYMLIIFYTGNYDGPVSKFLQNKSPNNFYCIYNRNARQGFKFIMHDAEHTLRTDAGEGPGIGLYENRVNIGMLNDELKMTVSSASKLQPQWLHFKLSDNAEYRIRFADHIYKHFYNNGWLTPGKTTALFQSRAKEIEMAIIGESARWGDAAYHPARTKDGDWQWAINDIVNNYFPFRTQIVIDQLKDANLYPSIDPPIFKINNEEVISSTIKIQKGSKIKLENLNSSGSIIFTVDGSDPRALGGEANGSALTERDKADITIDSTITLKSRIFNGTTWSALHEIRLVTTKVSNNLKITEINYHPLDADTIDDNEYEFIELKNIGSTPINLSKAFFKDGISYTFPADTSIAPNQFIILASNSKEFKNRYGFVPYGEYDGQLDNSGERITLCSEDGDTLCTVKYSDKAPWPVTADGSGFSLVTKDKNPQNDLDDPSMWRASIEINGSPGKDDEPSSSVVKSDNLIPEKMALYQNYPNPFNPVTKINYAVPTDGIVNIKIYDILGNEVAELVNEKKAKGYYSISFNASRLSSGVYIYSIKANGTMLSKAMVLLK